MVSGAFEEVIKFDEGIGDFSSDFSSAHFIKKCPDDSNCRHHRGGKLRCFVSRMGNDF